MPHPNAIETTCREKDSPPPERSKVRTFIVNHKADIGHVAIGVAGVAVTVGAAYLIAKVAEDAMEDIDTE